MQQRTFILANSGDARVAVRYDLHGGWMPEELDVDNYPDGPVTEWPTPDELARDYAQDKIIHRALEAHRAGQPLPKIDDPEIAAVVRRVIEGLEQA